MEAVPVRVLIVDDHDLVRLGLAELLGRDPQLAVVGAAATGEEALELFHAKAPHVTLVDLRMTPMDGVELIQRIRELDASARIVMLTNYDTDEDVFALDQPGRLLTVRVGKDERSRASYYVRHRGEVEILLRTLRDVRAGRRS